MNPFPSCLQGKKNALAGNYLTSVPIHDRQKRSKANIIMKNSITDACHKILREQAMRPTTKQLKIKDKNSENTKVY